MVELIVLNWLADTLSVPVYMERPYEVPESYVIVEKTGSSMSNHIYTATIAVQSHAGSLLGAAQLNELVKAAMDGMLALNSVSSCKLNADYNYTNTATKEYRYQAVYDIVAYCD